MRQGDPLSPLFFVLVAEALLVMLDKAVRRRLFSGFHVGNPSIDANHLQFVDDTILFYGANIEELVSLKATLRWFSMSSILKINYEKCELVCIRLDALIVSELPDFFGCKVGKFPLRYIGLPSCTGIRKRKLWDLAVEWIDS